MDNSNSCCNVSLKLKCWLILAKYGASKLELIKQTTQDAALTEFETRLLLRNKFSCCGWDKFTDFTRLVYTKTMALLSNHLCCPDWSIFYENEYYLKMGVNRVLGNDLVWQLNTVILQEIQSSSNTFAFATHQECYQLWNDIKQEILSIINSWPESTNIYLNYISACLSAAFVQRMKQLIEKYENSPQNTNIQWLFEDITSSKDDDSYLRNDDKNQFWFLTESLNLHFFEESNFSDYYCYLNEEDIALKLSEWLFKESMNDFRANTQRLLCFHDVEQTDVRVLDKQKLSECLDVPVTDLELYLSSSSSYGLIGDLCLSNGPHYYFNESALTELQPVRNSELSEMIKVIEETSSRENNLINSALEEDGDLQLNIPVSDIKVELNNHYEEDPQLAKSESLPLSKEETDGNCLKCDDSDNDIVSLPKLQIVGKHQAKEVERSHASYPVVQHKKRGRPRKIDEYNQTTPRNGQHKYSPENVLDCSTWISDNFLEVPGNKPAIDRARLYELYTNYCLLKLCTPVDRALFGKIIRKVFPELKSRRLIQNQVLKYHYVGLKPKFSELEQALLHTDSNNNPQEILLSYMPVIEQEYEQKRF